MRAAACVAWMLAGCTGPDGPPPVEPTGVAPLDPGVDCLGVVEAEHALDCTAGTWSGWVWVDAGCADEVVWRTWEPSLRHERHDLRRSPDDGATPATEAWALGPLAPAAGPADWRPGQSSAVPCDAADVTWTLSVEQGDTLWWCVTTGPEAARVETLPGAPAVLEGCTVLR